MPEPPPQKQTHVQRKSYVTASLIFPASPQQTMRRSSSRGSFGSRVAPYFRSATPRPLPMQSSSQDRGFQVLSRQPRAEADRASRHDGPRRCLAAAIRLSVTVDRVHGTTQPCSSAALGSIDPHNMSWRSFVLRSALCRVISSESHRSSAGLFSCLLREGAFRLWSSHQWRLDR